MGAAGVRIMMPLPPGINHRRDGSPRRGNAYRFLGGLAFLGGNPFTIFPDDFAATRTVLLVPNLRAMPLAVYVGCFCPLLSVFAVLNLRAILFHTTNKETSSPADPWAAFFNTKIGHS
jgi:hypothetical protein